MTASKKIPLEAMIFEIEICSFSFLVFPFANINSKFTLPTSLPTSKATLKFFEKGFQLHEYFQNRLSTYIFFCSELILKGFVI